MEKACIRVIGENEKLLRTTRVKDLSEATKLYHFMKENGINLLLGEISDQDIDEEFYTIKDMYVRFGDYENLLSLDLYVEETTF